MYINSGNGTIAANFLKKSWERMQPEGLRIDDVQPDDGPGNGVN